MEWIWSRTVLWILGFLILLRSLLSFRTTLHLLIRWYRDAGDKLHSHQTYKIPMYNDSLQENALYRKAAAYIGSLPSLEDSNNALLFSKKHSSAVSDLYLQLDTDQTVVDSFLGARVSWSNHAGESLVLRVRKRDRRRILRPYLQHVESVADEIEVRRREVRLYTNLVVLGGEKRRWKSVGFTHPSTMDSLAMDGELKNRVKADLEAFLKNKNYYQRLGRVWKRSYLLYGPPGTGKSSFVAAMAKFLSFDIYDLDLGRVSDGSDLKTLLLQTSPRSVIVVEDLDHYLFQNQNFSGNPGGGSTLSGVLNFMDGIFSCCGEERVIVFTMRETLSGIDPAVMRPGRLDVQLHFPLCNFTAFKTMASSYLRLKDHKLYPAVEEIFQNGGTMSQAEIGEIMIANKGSPSRALKTLINALQQSSAARRVGGLLTSIGSPPQRRRIEEEMEGNITDGEVGGVLNKEFRKLYGLIRMRSGSKKEGQPPPHPPSSVLTHRKQLSSSSVNMPPATSSDNSKESPPSS